MKVHYTGRQVEVTPLMKSHLEEKLDKIHKILGERLDLEAHVIFSLERQLHDVELKLNLKNQSLVGIAANYDPYVCLQEAAERLETQALKYKNRWREIKRRPPRPALTRRAAAAG